MPDEGITPEELDQMKASLRPVDHHYADDEQYLGCAECGWPRGEHAPRCSYPVRKRLIAEVERLGRLVRAVLEPDCPFDNSKGNPCLAEDACGPCKVAVAAAIEYDAPGFEEAKSGT